MFGTFNKKQKSDLEEIIEKDGTEYAARRLAEIIAKKLPTKEIAYQFVLEEIEAASQGNQMAISFARNSGISAQEYEGALKNSRPEVDGPGGPQQTLLGICTQLMSNTNLMVKLRTEITDNIMRYFSIGKYEHQAGTSVNAENDSDLTSPFEPTPELQSEDGVKSYMLKISKFNHSKSCIELSNVMSAKYNLMSMPTGLNNFHEVQALITDLSDKALAIFLAAFGQPAILRFCNGDLRVFNELVNKTDEIVANLDLEPERHGEQLLNRLRQHLNL